MSEKPDLIERANLLIKAETGMHVKVNAKAPRQLRRRRSFIADDRRIDVGEIRARLAASRADDDDLPVLTEEVHETLAQPADIAMPPLGDPPIIVLAGEIERHLAERLPDLLQASFANAARQLQQEIEAGLVRILREFAGRHASPTAPPREQESGDGHGAD